MKTLKRFVLVGAPASGKGTQAHFLAEKFGLETLSTGALLRHEIETDSELGKQAASYMGKAMLVPDEIVNGIVRNWMATHTEKGWLLDGYPRTLAQAEALEADLAALGMPLDVVVWLDVTHELIEARMLRRRECSSCGYITRDGENTCPSCGGIMKTRGDDNPEAFARRRKDYERLTEPVARYFLDKGQAVHISVTEEGEPEDVFLRMKHALEDFAKNN